MQVPQILGAKFRDKVNQSTIPFIHYALHRIREGTRRGFSPRGDARHVSVDHRLEDEQRRKGFGVLYLSRQCKGAP